MAKNAFLSLMTKYQWSAKAINAFAFLFTQLELHPLQQREFGKQAFITYQAQVWQEWHDQLKPGSAFNIGIVNEDLLQSIYRELLDKAQRLLLNEVSLLCSVFTCQLLLMVFALSFLFPSPLIAYYVPCTMHHAPCGFTLDGP